MNCLRMKITYIVALLLITGQSVFSQQPLNAASPKKTLEIPDSDTIPTLTFEGQDLMELQPDSISGDYNGDGKAEYMWLETPQVDGTEMDCVGDCTSYIRFSDPKIPSIEVKNCINGDLKNEGDLNYNRTDEVGLLPGLFTSCWNDYHVWTLIKGEWAQAIKPFPTHCNQWEKGIKPVEIDPKHKGFVIINFSTNDGTDILTESTSVKVLR